MTAILSTRQIKDGVGNIFLQKVLDMSGTGAGPYVVAYVPLTADGSATLDFEGLTDNVIAAINALGTGISLAAGTAVIGSTHAAGPDFQATGVTPVANSLSAPGQSGWLTLKGGRGAYAWLSGTGSASGYFAFSNDGGNTSYQLELEGNVLGTWAFNGSPVLVPIPGPDQPGLKVSLVATAVSGSLSFTLAT